MSAESKLTESGVFKGVEGLRGLLESQEFWDNQTYGTRLYYGNGISDYLHRDVLRVAVKVLDETSTDMPMEYQETQSAEAEPDVYAGPNCDEIRSRWVADIEKEGRCEIGETLEMSAKHFSPGTKVSVLEPLCPKCKQILEFCRNDDNCDCVMCCCVLHRIHIECLHFGSQR